MEYFALVASILGCIFCPFWIKSARDSKDQGYGIFSLCGSIFLLAASIYVILYNNGLI